MKLFQFLATIATIILSTTITYLVKYFMSDAYDPNCWAVVAHQKSDTDASFKEFETEFKNKTNMSIREFFLKDAVKLEVTDEGHFWKYGNFRLVLRTATKLYSLQEYT